MEEIQSKFWQNIKYIIQKSSKVAGEFGSQNLYRMLGYFSIIGLLRVHCLLGDFTLALKTMDNIGLNKKVFFLTHV